MLFRYCCLLFIFLTCSLPQNLSAGTLGAGELDPSFDNDGRVQTTIDVFSNARGLALQPDGKIVAVGITTLNGNDFALARYNSDGSLDNSFGTGGIVTTDFFGNGFSDSAASVVILGDGKILVGGGAGATNSHINFALARYNPDGSLDTSFGTGGLVSFDFLGVEANDEILSIALQDDDKIVAVGFTNMDRGVADDLFAVARFNPDGSLDTGFANNGRFTTDFGGGVMSNSTARKVLIRPGGMILVGGDSDANGTSDLALLQLDDAGNPDGTFGTNGEMLTDLGDLELGRSLALLPNGQFYQVGSTTNIMIPTEEAVLVRYQADGSVDTSFGNNGVVTEDFSDVGGTGAQAKDLVVYADGKIVIGGDSFVDLMVDPTLTLFALACFRSDGTLDPNFGTGGLVLTDFGGGVGSTELLNALVLQPDGKIVAAGAAGPDAGSLQFALARYLGNTADLAVEKLSDIANASPGQNITFTLTATNLGPDSAPGVMVDDIIPAGAQFISVDPAQGSCMVNGAVLCDLGTLDVNQSVVITLVMQADGSTSSLSNTAVITGEVVDPDPENNSSTVTVTVSSNQFQGSGCSLDHSPPNKGTFFIAWLTALGIIWQLRRRRDRMKTRWV